LKLCFPRSATLSAFFWWRRSPTASPTGAGAANYPAAFRIALFERTSLMVSHLVAVEDREVRMRLRCGGRGASS
jgi:hypothetical protein